MRGTHLARVYRPAPNRKHDLNVVRGLVDVSGNDVWVTVRPADGEIIDLNPGSVPVRAMNLWMPSKYDLDIGYFVELKRTRVLDGEREVVEEELVSGVVSGVTSLSVAKTTGFREGDGVVVWDGDDTWEDTKVRTVGATTLTLYSDCALVGDYAVGSVVRASRMYRVEALPEPDDVGPFRVAYIKHTLRQLAVS